MRVSEEPLVGASANGRLRTALAAELGVVTKLWPAEVQLVKAARDGDVFDPLRRSAPHPSQSDGWVGATVRASVVAALLTGLGGSAHRCGVRLRGVKIQSTLDLGAAKLLVPLELDGCRLTSGVALDDARGSSVAIRSCCVAGGGVEAARLRLEGCLDLTGSELAARVSLHDAWIGADLICRDTRFHRGKFEDALYAPGVSVQADVLLTGARSTGCIDFKQAKIERSIESHGAEYACTTKPALRLRGASVGGELDCCGLKVAGTPSAIDAEHLTAGNVRFSRLVRSDGTAQVVEARGCLSFEGAELKALLADGAELHGSQSRLDEGDEDSHALDLTGAKVRGAVSLAPTAEGPARVWGKVSLTGAELDGDLDLRGAQIIRAGKVAIDAAGFRAATVCMAVGWVGSQPRSFLAEGAVDFSNATLDDLDCGGARLVGRGGLALSASGATVKRRVFLARPLDKDGQPIVAKGRTMRFRATGQVDLQDITTAQVLCRGARFENAEGQALILYGAKVTEQLLLEAAVHSDGGAVYEDGTGGKVLRMEAYGTVRLQNASIGQLSLRGARLHAPPMSHALNARSVEVRGDVLLDAQKAGDGSVISDDEGPVRFEATGGVSFAGASIAGSLDCTEASLQALDPESGEERERLAFDASTATITRKLVWCEVTCSGHVDLHGLQAGSLEDTILSWPSTYGHLKLDGFTYTALLGTQAAEWKQRRDRWLGKTKYAAQPYEQLAAVYRSAGDSHAARKISMASFNAQLTLNEWNEHPPKSLGQCLRLAGRWVLRALIGHGYEPLRALLPIAALLVLAVIVTNDAVTHNDMVRARALPSEKPATAANAKKKPVPEAKPTDCRRKDYPCLQPWLYAADLLVPVVNLGQRDAWRATRDHRWLPPVMTVLGWMLTTLIVAGFTGLVRRE